MAMDSASVYMCFPCYQEFDTLEEVLAHQLTCTTENVGSGAPTPVSIPFLQTQQQVYTQPIAPSPAPQTKASVSSVLPSSGAPGLAMASPKKPSSGDQPKILYQCGDCDALFHSLILWQQHRKHGQCLQTKAGPTQPQPEETGSGSGSELAPEGEGKHDQAEVEVDLGPDEQNEPNSMDDQEGGGGKGRGRGRGRGRSQEMAQQTQQQQDVVKSELSAEKEKEEDGMSAEDTSATLDHMYLPNTTNRGQEGGEEEPEIESIGESTGSKASEIQAQAAHSSTEAQSAADRQSIPDPAPSQDPPDPTPSQDPPDPAPSQDLPADGPGEEQTSYYYRMKAAKKLKPPSSLLCVDCGSSFGMVSELVTHRKAQHGLKEALHHCTVCGESFLNTTLFLYHRKQHKEKAKEGVTQTQAQGGQMQDADYQYYKIVTLQQEVVEEMVEESEEETAGVVDSQNNGTEEQNQDGTPSTSTVSTCAPVQVPKVVQGQSFLCAQCGASFSKEPELSAHRRDKHGLNEPLHHCSQCNQSFMNTTQYLYHRRQHRGEPGTGAGAAAAPQGSPRAPKRMLSPPAVSSSAASGSPAKIPAIRIRSINDLKENKDQGKEVNPVILKEEQDEKTVVGEQPDTNFPPPAKLMQDWSRTPLPHVCPHCGQTFTRRGFLRAHVFSHTGEKLFTCKVCQKSFASSPNLLRHSLTHMGTKPFPCSVCGKRFSQPGVLKRHGLTHSQPKSRRRRSRWKKRTPEGEDGESQLFACPNCTARFQTDQQLQEHRLLHTSHPFPCSVCGEAFKRRKELDLHSLIHQDKEPVLCPHCSSQFLNQSVLDIHLQRCTSSVEDKTVGRGRGQGRGRSMGQVECDMCGHCCMTQEGLDLHRLSHTGQTPLRCPLSPCRRRFASSSALGEHIVAHCQGTLGKGRGSKRFHCQICGKDFAYTSTFNVHMRIHTDERPFECSTCGKRFRQLPHLKDHERIHSGLRPFCCWVCGKAFCVAGRLTEHARIHSGETPYTCHHCPSAFRSRSNLDKHIRLHDDGTGGTTANDAEAEGARVLLSTGTGSGGEGESAVQTILLVQADGTTEGVMVPAVSVSEHSSGTMFSGQAGSSQVVFLGGQAISVPSLSAIMEGHEIPSVTVVEGQDVPHTIEFILEETIS
ncbi:zinc finger protein 574-like isoform X1 [Salvelinus namaycush]|uniref:Zinc finger protein 574-like isoform X1 n=1 Tax=Salvelinus namaycush TaxID=8040 RepID=A0A8U0U7W0_SALNM|nr:zinc finger protein 574-like isoform X1 [Salvelinus namaycush]XP_038842279.1 zinc finger protein 574-like isoform X1 [Salvelinus namaycush]